MPSHAYWKEWASVLQRTGLTDPAAALLEAAGPLSLLAAQAVHFCQPFIGIQSQSQALASMLEDPYTCREFVDFLRQEEVE